MENENGAQDGSSSGTQTTTPAEAATESTQSVSPPVSESVANVTSDVAPSASNKPIMNPNDMGFLNDVSIALTIEIGRTQIKIRDLLNLTKDSIIDLNKSSGEPVDIYANGKMISRGHIITANGKYCVRLTSIAPPVTDKVD